MPPYTSKSENILEKPNLEYEEKETVETYKTLWGYFGQEIKFGNAIGILFVHILAIYAILSIRLYMWKLMLFNYLYVALFAGLGVTAGAHRLFTHRCYKAKLPLRILLMLAYSASSQNTLYDWVRDHRVHHKFSETDADPHNSKRGFFFAHCGWLMLKKHSEVLTKGKKVDCSDILEDPVIKFHQKYFFPLIIIFGHVIPIILPMIFLDANFMDCLRMNIMRWTFQINGTWSVNSAAHLWGTRPYDKDINPVETKWVSFVALGEGWHNYHHTFPWDYKAAEWQYYLNITTLIIDFFAKIGWAYDLKQPSKEMVEKIVKKSGDGSHFKWGHQEVEESEGMEILSKKRT